MDFSIIEKNSNKFNTLDLWFDILAYLNSGEVINSEMFHEGSVREKLIREAKPIFSNLEKYNSLSSDDIFLKMSLSPIPGSLLKCKEILNNSIPNWDYIYKRYMEEQKISEINCKLLINRLITLEKRTGKIIPIKNKLYRSLLKNSILNLLTGRRTVNELRDKLECPEYRIRNLLNKMVREGIVEKFDTDPISFKIA
ncbi:MAG TPA: hypothetical protein EYP86_02715 [Candidatus Altiarchaeales archaeon]|nr:hypothetical protein [Candidatus Altiarchaeales archaeon]